MRYIWKKDGVYVEFGPARPHPCPSGVLPPARGPDQGGGSGHPGLPHAHQCRCSAAAERASPCAARGPPAEVPHELKTPVMCQEDVAFEPDCMRMVTLFDATSNADSSPQEAVRHVRPSPAQQAYSSQECSEVHTALPCPPITCSTRTFHYHALLNRDRNMLYI